jgi:peptidyl-prolyl cis-trans isomerase D
MTIIVNQLKGQKAGELAAAKARETLDELRDPARRDAAETRLAADIKRSQPFTRQGQIPGLGQGKEMATAAFLDPAGTWIDGVYQSIDGTTSPAPPA